MKNENQDKLPEGQCSVKLDGQTFTFRRPTQDEFEDWHEKSIGTKRKGPPNRELANLCLLSPEVDALTAAFSKYPGAVLRIVDTLVELAGAEVNVVVGKG